MQILSIHLKALKTYLLYQLTVSKSHMNTLFSVTVISHYRRVFLFWVFALGFKWVELFTPQLPAAVNQI